MASKTQKESILLLAEVIDTLIGHPAIAYSWKDLSFQGKVAMDKYAEWRRTGSPISD